MIDPPQVPMLEVDGLSVHFGGVRAVDDVSFAVEAGLLYGIMGPNGSGKSTLLAAVTRLVTPTAGTVRLYGEDVTRLAPERLAARGVARSFQTARLLPTMSVRENVALGADVRHRGRPSRARRRALDETVSRAMERAGIAGHAERRPDELSYGDQRRVEIARALAMEPAVLLLDEPTAGMNGDERNAITALLAALRGQGVTQVLVEHDVPMLVGLCDRLVAMVQGEVVTSGVPADVVQDARVRESYLGRKGARDA